MKIETFNKLSEMLKDLKISPDRVHVYEAEEYLRFEFTFDKE